MFSSDLEEVSADHLPRVLEQWSDNQGFLPGYVIASTDMTVLHLFDNTLAHPGPPDAGISSYPTAFDALMPFVYLLQGFVLKAEGDNDTIIVQNQPSA